MVFFFVQETVGLVQSGPPTDLVQSRPIPVYRSELHLNQLNDDWHKSKLEGSDLKDYAKSKSCKILLLFSEDGVQASDLAISLAQQVTFEVIKVHPKHLRSFSKRIQIFKFF